MNQPTNNVGRQTSLHRPKLRDHRLSHLALPDGEQSAPPAAGLQSIQDERARSPGSIEEDLEHIIDSQVPEPSWRKPDRHASSHSDLVGRKLSVTEAAAFSASASAP